MKREVLVSVIAGLVVALIFTALSLGVRDTRMVWQLTRAFGLISFVTLFLTVALGELRLLSLVKARFRAFRFHTPLAIFSLFLVAVHGVAAIADNYQWGATTPAAQYLGFSFSDHWLVYLSLGTLAFYLLLLVSVTSHHQGMQILGFKRWKLVHYLSYGAFAMSYVHSAHLGTDLKAGTFAPILSGAALMMFLFVSGLLLARLVRSRVHFDDQLEISLTGALCVLVVVGGLLTVLTAEAHSHALNTADHRSDLVFKAIEYHDGRVDALSQEVQRLSGRLAEVQNGTAP